MTASFDDLFDRSPERGRGSIDDGVDDGADDGVDGVCGNSGQIEWGDEVWYDEDDARDWTN